MGRHGVKITASKFHPMRFAKLIIAVAGAAGSAWTAAKYGDGVVTQAELLNVVISAFGAVQVWYVSETRNNPEGKAVIAGIIAAMVAVNSYLSGGVSTTEWVQIAVAGLTAAGVFGKKNKE